MKNFILLMFDDAINQKAANDGEQWDRYFSRLRASGQFDGGSAIGSGATFRKSQADAPSALAINGFFRIRAENMSEARSFLVENPIYEAGGTVEIRELPRDE